MVFWSSRGVGFLSMIAGILNSNEELYEAAAIDGIKNRFQEMIYITIPQMKTTDVIRGSYGYRKCVPEWSYIDTAYR